MANNLTRILALQNQNWNSYEKYLNISKKNINVQINSTRLSFA